MINIFENDAKLIKDAMPHCDVVRLDASLQLWLIQPKSINNIHHFKPDKCSLLSLIFSTYESLKIADFDQDIQPNFRESEILECESIGQFETYSITRMNDVNKFYRLLDTGCWVIYKSKTVIPAPSRLMGLFHDFLYKDRLRDVSKEFAGISVELFLTSSWDDEEWLIGSINS